MAAKILVATPHVAFGELIRQSLVESAGYTVDVTNRGVGLVDRCRAGAYRLLIMDSDLPDVSIPDMGKALLAHLPELRLALFPPGNDPHSPLLLNFAPHAFLRKPFYLPDLLETVERLVPAPGAQPVPKPPLHPDPPGSSAGLDWLDDASRAAQHLTRLSLQSSAQAALITRSGKLWAYAGQLQQDAAQELASVVTRYWDMNGGTDLARFARLTSTGVQYMLYATPVTGDLVLALAFDASTPFSRIRLQASDLARALTVPPPEPAPESPRLRPAEEALESEEEPEEVEPIDISSLPPLFDDVPPPNPEPVSSEWVPETPQPAMTVGSQPAPAEAPIRVEVDAPVKPPTNAAVADEEPASIREEGAPPELEPVSPGLYDLNYACVLLPRFSHHYLTGELAAKLAVWTPDICLGFGWRLEGLSIRPDYMQWIVRVLPATAPGVMIRQMRQALSQRIFETFPHLQYENLLGDFWAPGYLVVGGTQMATGQMVRDFITQTRQRQGMR